MMRLRLAAEAERDPDTIFIYWAEQAGVDVADRIVERFALLCEFPEAGRMAAEIAPGVRCFPAGSHLIYYRKTRRALEILHIFHGAREQARVFHRTSPR